MGTTSCKTPSVPLTMVEGTTSTVCLFCFKGEVIGAAGAASERGAEPDSELSTGCVGKLGYGGISLSCTCRGDVGRDIGFEECFAVVRG